MRLAGQCARASRAIGIALACQRCPSASETCGFSRAPTTLAARSAVIAVAAVGPLCTLQALLHPLRLIRPQRRHNRVDQFDLMLAPLGRTADNGPWCAAWQASRNLEPAVRLAHTGA